MTVIDRVSRQSLGNISFMPSIRNGLVGLFQPRISDAQSAINRAPNGVNGVVTGSPAYVENGGAILGPSAYIETAILETVNFTLISIARILAAGGNSYISTLAGSVSSTPFAMLGSKTSSPQRFGVGAKTTPESSMQYFGYDFPSGTGDFEFMAAACDGANFLLAMPRNPPQDPDGVRSVALSGTRDTPTAAYRIGSARVTTSLYPNATEHLLDMIYTRALTEMEIRAVYAEARAYYAQRGVVI